MTNPIATEPSVAGAITVYAIPAILAAFFLDEWGAIVSLPCTFLLRGMTKGPLFREDWKENELIHGRAAKKARRDRLERERAQGKQVSFVKQSWSEAVMAIVAPLIGVPLVIASLGGVVLALIGPSQCSSRNGNQEYRAL